MQDEFLCVKINRLELKHDLYYSLHHNERMIELEFSEPLDENTHGENIILEDRNGLLEDHYDLHFHHRKVLLTLRDGFRFRDGWKYNVRIRNGIRSTSGSALQKDVEFQLRTLTNHGHSAGLQSGQTGDTLVRKSIAIISDIHMGDARAIDKKYSWFYENAGALKAFLDYVKDSNQVRQLVILGDLFDEWMIPYNINPFDTSLNIQSTKDYFKAIAGNATNAPIIEKFRAIALDPDIELIYVTGNHDMLNTEAIIGEIIPGITWKGGPDGLGEYSPFNHMIFEHGHRYDFFNCPHPLVNPGHMLPPGYFISRMYAQGLMEKNNPAQKGLWEYQGDFEFLAAWEIAFLYTFLHFEMLPPDMNEKNILMGGVNNYDDPLSFHGTRDMYAASIEENWAATQDRNQVPVHIKCCLMAIWNGHSDLFGAARMEYLESSAPHQYNIVAFGHTHEPMLEVYPSGKYYSSIYANSGSWLNKEESSHKVRTYLMIRPANWTGSELDVVSLFQYNPHHSGPKYQPELISEESIEADYHDMN
ncbi:MAG: metallophosphoesterase [Bacteroidales bacterium]|nr:metallophosphoesterase [Bacteroidales bacterium]